MIIGHIPAGYLAALAANRFGARIPIVPFVLGAALPDLDMLYFLLIDGGSTHHHSYITHRPITWMSLLLVGLVARKFKFGLWAIVLAMGAILHVALDTTLGSISWLWPFSDYARPLIVVPATMPHWLLSFMVHWTFWVEIVLTIVAIVIFAKRRFRENTT